MPVLLDCIDGARKEKPYNRPITDEAVFKVTKGIFVKFIEAGQLVPANFEETYERVFQTVNESTKQF